jgi:hypothetical protein
MTFAAPLFLLAAMAAAIPVVLHMINRQKAKDMPFPTLRFLKLSVQKTRRRKRVHDALLMAIRAAVLLLIAAGLARPTMTSLSALWGGAHCAAAIILDNSASMGMIDQDRVRFDTATAAAGQILEQLGDGDQAALLLTGGPTFAELGKLDRTQDSVRQILGQCRVSYQRADLAMKIEQARKLLAKSEAPNKQIYVITDMQKISWEKLFSRDPKGSANEEVFSRDPKGSAVPLIIIDCNRTPKPNVAVQGVELEAAVPVAGLPVKATVTLLNTSTVAQQRLVELTIDGAKEASSPELSIPPEGRVKHTFAFTFQRGGLHRGEVHLVGEDGSKYDDRRYFTLEVDQGIPVAVVKPQRHEIPYLDDGYYLERALSPGRSGGGAIRTTTLVAGDLISEPLEKYKVVFCVNLPALGADAAERLRSYVAGGGNVVWICGDNVNPEAYNLMNEEAKGGLLPAPLADVRVPGPQDNRDSWHVSFLDKKHPALSHLVEPASLYESVLVYKHVRMAAGQGGTWVLARLDDGEPLLVQRKVEKGRALMLGTSAHVNWSNLPLRPIFLPLVARLTFDLAEAEQARHNVVAGQPLVLQFADETRPVGVEVIPPSGETLRLKTEGQQGKPGQTFRYADTYAIGVYLLRLLDAVRPTQIAYSVNLDPDEPDPATMDRNELEERLGDTPLAFAENPDDLSATFAWLREGKSLWGLFLTAVLIALVFETFISNRLR